MAVEDVMNPNTPKLQLCRADFHDAVWQPTTKEAAWASETEQFWVWKRFQIV